ncbi:MAG: hypothetical protein KU28_01760 [Sulfurovum sp. PC08-66]|nr:MAG: hypothetical protein KU28_01760 [Sulfurovum sp. PC08-66]KIM12660.1 MAG: hypothetical protein KU37_01865 [Sulfuricurvum sp. PC08-66]
MIDFTFGVTQALGALAVGMVLMFVYLFSKEKSTHHKIHTIAKSVGEIQRQLYESEMRLNEKIKNITVGAQGLTAVEVETLMDVTISERIMPAEQALRVVQEEFENLSNQVNSRINSIENSMKSVTIARTTVGSTDDKKIRQLFAQGQTLEQIAKELRISSAEVEFSLKIADFQ